MQTFPWKILSEDSLINYLALNNPVTRKQRLAAYEGIHSAPQAVPPRETQITIPQETTLELPIMELEPGVTVLSIIQKPFSTLKLTYIEGRNMASSSMLVLRIFLEEGAHMESLTALTGLSYGSLFMDTHLDGAGSSTEQKNIFFGAQQQRYDMFSTTILRGESTRAHVVAKGALTDSAAARFDGSIEIEQTAKNSNAVLIEHTLLLSPTAQINAIPALKIGTNDVKASHSASVTRVDDEHLFYLQSRGIGEDEGTQLIVEGFLAAAAGGSPYEKEIASLIHKKHALIKKRKERVPAA